MLAETETIAKVWDLVRPALEAGMITTGAVEAGKYVVPSLFAGKESDRAAQISIFGALGGKALGVAPFAAIGWVPLLVTSLVAPLIARVVHDIAMPTVGDKVLKPILGPVSKPIGDTVDKALLPVLKLFGKEEQK